MQISGTPPSATTPPGTDPARTTVDFRVGQILRALAGDVTRDGLLQLRIGRNRLLARSPMSVTPGQVLTLRVERAGTTPELRVLEPLGPAALKTDALRQALPRMTSLATVLEPLLRARIGRNEDPLPQDLRQMIRQVLAQLPQAADAASGSGLREAVAQSGLFAEARLLRNRPAPDLKTALLRLATRLRTESTAPATPHGNAPPTASRQGQTPAGRPPSGDAEPAKDTGPGAEGKRSPGGRPGPAPSPAPPASGRPSAARGGDAPAVAKGPPQPTPAAQPDKGSAAGRPATPAAAPGPPPPGGSATGTGSPVPSPGARPATPIGPGPATGSATAPAGSPAAAGTPVPGAAGQTPAGTTATLPSPAGGDRPGPEPAARERAPAGFGEIPGGKQVQELARQVEGALSRIRYNQLSSLPQEDSTRQVWQLDLPLRNGERLDLLQLRVEEQDPQGIARDGNSSWTVNLAFDLDPLGPVHARIGLQGDAVSSSFWAERERTAALISRRLGELRQGFERVGLIVGKLASHQGRPVPPDQGPDRAPLLDEQA